MHDKVWERDPWIWLFLHSTYMERQELEICLAHLVGSIPSADLVIETEGITAR
jgi:hypothetical protein